MLLSNEKTNINLDVISNCKSINPCLEGVNGFYQFSLPGLQEFKFLINSSNKEIFFTVEVMCGNDKLASPFDGNCYFKDKTELSSLKNGGKNMIIGIDRDNKDYNITNKWIFVIKTFIDDESITDKYRFSTGFGLNDSFDGPIYRSLGSGGCYTGEGSDNTKKINTTSCKMNNLVGTEIKFVNQFLCSDSDEVRTKKLKNLEYHNNKVKLEKLTKQLQSQEAEKEIITKHLIQKTDIISSIMKEIEETKQLIGPSPESQFIELS